MLKYISIAVLGLVVIVALIGLFHLYRVSNKNRTEMSQYQGKTVTLNQDLGKVLVVYYSMSGHTKEIAEIIQAKTDADIYEIKTLEQIKQNPKLHLAVREQLKTKSYPEIQTDFPDFTSYDVIFIGSPVWWYTAATPFYSFLQKADFQNKNVALFSTQGSNVGTFEEDVRLNIKNANLLKYEKFNNLSKKFDKEVENKITTWLNEL
ncbi:MAG: flavodoxin [Alphaproteobacteria bacterium]|nr:flavodoxin [Alphaproteobacteria bacterium]